MAVILPARVLLDLKARADAQQPYECCGLLVGTPGVVEQAWEFANSSPDPVRRYEISPAHLISAQKRARAATRQILGVYHSHPDSPAYFSPTDLANAVPWFLYLIIGTDGWRLYDAHGHTVEATVIE